MSTEDTQMRFSSQAILMALAVFIVVHVLLSYVGFVPSEVSQFNQDVIYSVKNIHRISYSRPPQPVLPRPELTATEAETAVGVVPERITIEEIGVDVEIISPDDTSIETLDAALKEGVVHYPGSGGIGGSRRMFLFGHSSRLPIVQNEAYRSFNGLAELSAGDTITVTAEDEERVYQVTEVKVVDKDEALVSFVQGGGELTLSTCTTFGSRENRVVVRAEVMN